MISDVGKWVDFLNKSLGSVGCTVDKHTICKDLRLTSIPVLEEYVNNLKGRDLTKRLKDIKYSFEIMSFAIKNNIPEETEKLPFLAITHSLLCLIKEVEEEAIKAGKKFDVSKYLKKQEKNLKKAKNSEDIIKLIGDDTIEESITNESKNQEDEEETEYEEDSDDDVKEIASSKVKEKSLVSLKNKKSKSKNNFSEKEDDEEDEEDEVDEEDDEDEEDDDFIVDDDEVEYEDDDEEEYEDGDEDEEWEEDEEEEEEEEEGITTRSKSKKRGGGFFLIMNSKKKKRKKIEDKDELKLLDFINQAIDNNGTKGLSGDERESFENKLLRHFSKFNLEKKNEMLDKFKSILDSDTNLEPTLFKIINLNISNETKNDILNEYLTMEGSYQDRSKLKQWLDNVLKIPFGVLKGINFSELKDDPKETRKFVLDVKSKMNTVVKGHEEAKKNVVQMVAQYITNPDSNGSCLGIWGPPGNGKTTLIKEGIAKAMNREFVFISLGGAQDGCFLEGHSFTYEGSIYGKIAGALINSKCMNPIIYFDELDKISDTYRGMEITNILVHLIDPAQNMEFIDKYFHNIKLDLSKVTFMFSYNDPSKVDPILMDRITQVETKYLLIDEKIDIGVNYLLPNILNEVGLEKSNIKIENDLVEEIVSNYTFEGGVRKLKKILFSFVRQLNILNLTDCKIDNKLVKWPFKINKNSFNLLIKDFDKVEHDMIIKEDRVGVINGLWASVLGIGGISTIEGKWIPSKDKFHIKATGNLQKVLNESVEVANTLVWDFIDPKIKKKIEDSSVDDPKGIHIHWPNAGQSKDGPSAGTAMTVLIYSMYTNTKIRHDLAITGEISLNGKVMKIGGLEEKLQGAKRAGVKLVLYPKSNSEDVDKIKERNPKLIDNNFKIIPVENIKEVMKIVFPKK